MRSIKEQEEIVEEAFRCMERTAEAAEAKMDEWDILRDKEQKQFEAWRVEHRILSEMKEKQERLEAAGWKVIDVDEFLGLSESEMTLVNMKVKNMKKEKNND